MPTGTISAAQRHIPPPVVGKERYQPVPEFGYGVRGHGTSGTRQVGTGTVAIETVFYVDGSPSCDFLCTDFQSVR